MIFIPEDHHGPGVRLRNTAAFEEMLSAPVALNGTGEAVDHVKIIVADLPEEDRDALSLSFGDRLWGRDRWMSEVGRSRAGSREREPFEHRSAPVCRTVLHVSPWPISAEL